MFQRMSLPMDGSKRAERAIPLAARIARAYGSSLILLQVVGTQKATRPDPAQESDATS